jgi:hypothetical protein
LGRERLTKIQIGRVWIAPAVNVVTMISSKESANASSPPARRAVRSCGNVMYRNVCHVDEGDSDLLLDSLQLDLHLLSQLEVEGAERLVQEENLRPVDDRPCQGDALALTARELARLALAKARQLNHRESVVHTFATLCLRNLPDAESVLDVFGDGHVRKERVVLEDRVDVPVVWGKTRDVRPAKINPSVIRLLEARHKAQGGCLSGPRRPEQGEELADGDLEIDAVHGDHVAEALTDGFEPDVGRALTLRELDVFSSFFGPRRQGLLRGSRGLGRGPRRL